MPFQMINGSSILCSYDGPQETWTHVSSRARETSQNATLEKLLSRIPDWPHVLSNARVGSTFLTRKPSYMMGGVVRNKSRKAPTEIPVVESHLRGEGGGSHVRALTHHERAVGAGVELVERGPHGACERLEGGLDDVMRVAVGRRAQPLDVHCDARLRHQRRIERLSYVPNTTRAFSAICELGNRCASATWAIGTERDVSRV